MSGYTLTTEHLRRMWVLESNLLDHDDVGPAFDRWLAGVKAEAIRETATLTTRRGQGFVYIKDILEYARRVRNGKA